MRSVRQIPAATPGPGKGKRPGSIRPTLVALSALLLAWNASAGHANPDPVAIATKAKPSLSTVSWIDVRRPHTAFVRVGVAVRQDGLIVVAGPVAASIGRYLVRLPDQTSVRAEFVAADSETALTLLRVPDKTLLPLADLSKEPGLALPVGEAITLVSGDGAIARGALRAIRRYDRVRTAQGAWTRTTGLLESALTSLASDRGAPWFDAKGRLVGLHYGRTTGTDPALRARARAAGLRSRSEVTASYAVPANVLRIVWPLLAEHRRVPRGALKVRTQILDDAMRAQLCPGCGGQVVVDVEPEGPAADAGLRPHDVILAIAGVPMPIDRTLHDALLPHRPGAQVTLEILRAGTRTKLTATLADRDR